MPKRNGKRAERIKTGFQKGKIEGVTMSTFLGFSPSAAPLPPKPFNQTAFSLSRPDFQILPDKVNRNV